MQRGAASFVAQLRDTKDNSDVLVSLILTKEMLLVAKKPSYKTLYTLKYAGGLKVSFCVNRVPIRAHARALWLFRVCRCFYVACLRG